jgi:CheY-like chemotaxis protein
MPSNAKNILLVEDNAVAREGLAVILRREGHEVALVENGLEALNYLRENPTPHVILLDMHLPVLDGWRFLEKISGLPLNPRPCIVLTTGNPLIGRDWAVAHGCDLVRKPIEPDALFDAIRVATVTLNRPTDAAATPNPGGPS